MNLSTYNVFVRHKIDEDKYELRLLKKMVSQVVQRNLFNSEPVCYVQQIDSDREDDVFRDNRVILFKDVSDVPPTTDDSNPHDVLIPMTPITADELSSTILTSEA